MGVKGAGWVRMRLLSAALALVLGAGASGAQGFSAEPAAIENVLSTLEAAGATEAPSVFTTSEGFLRYLAAPRGGLFQVREDAAKSADPFFGAKSFVDDHGRAFGAVSDGTAFVPYRIQEMEEGRIVRLKQEYEGIPVFGAQTVVRIDGQGNVRHVLSDILRDTRPFDRGDVALTPTVGVGAAVSEAKRAVAEPEPQLGPPHLTSVMDPELTIFSPSVMGQDGPDRLAYRIRLKAISPVFVQAEAFVDAHTGVAIWHYSLIDQMLQREIFDFANQTFVQPPFPARREGDPATGVVDVDEAYQFLEDTYNFYLNELGWDSYDNEGSPLVANVRLPFQNAFYSPMTDETSYGTGWATDDVVGHEITHAVTQYTSGLIYFGFSGAINESMSDIFGEFIDLTNNAPGENEDVRWLIGEDIPLFARQRQVVPEGEADPEDIDDSLPPGIRSMQDPTIFGDPDRLGSDMLADVNSFFDNGGVHINSGIGNKMAYLLTDGDTFNGQVVEGMGISTVAQLFFGAQLTLTPAADYEDLYFALMASAEDLGLTANEIANLHAAAEAVEIAPEIPELTEVRGFRATPTEDIDGNPVIALTWETPSSDFLQGVTLLRSLTGFPSDPLNDRILAQGRIDSHLDFDVQVGTRYYYTLIAQLQTTPIPAIFHATAVAGDLPVPAPVEAFVTSRRPGGPSNPFDLSFSQILFSPTGPPVSPVNMPARGQDYNNYVVTHTPEVFSLPVQRQDGQGNAAELPLEKDGGVFVMFEPGSFFPLFGVPYSSLYLSANGYITPVPVEPASVRNFPTLASHFEIPRISFLFSDLSFNTGGLAWGRILDDRLVVTFENVPEFDLNGAFLPNTVQVELYYSGHIRITYQQIAIRNGIVGLSDGRGLPVDPNERFPFLRPAATSMDFSEQPQQPDRLTFLPRGSARVTAGERLAFDVQTVGAAPGAAPVLTGTWNRSGPAPFADTGNGAGTFNWLTGIEERGFVTFRAEARQGTERAYQDVRISLNEVIIPPQARNLGISTGSAFEIPTQTRSVSTNRPLFAQYEYFHPEQSGSFREGPSLVLWFKNGEFVPSLNNSLQVPATFTRGGDQWFFRVTPISENFIVGEDAISPQVYVTGGPQLAAISPSFGALTGGTTVTIRGEDLDGVIEVLFGGVKAPSFTSRGRNELQTVTPLHPKGPVDVVVRTNRGLGRLANGFTYLSSAADFRSEDVNGDGVVDALDVQIVVQAILEFGLAKETYRPDVNGDGSVTSADLQQVVNAALRR